MARLAKDNDIPRGTTRVESCSAARRAIVEQFPEERNGPANDYTWGPISDRQIDCGIDRGHVFIPTGVPADDRFDNRVDPRTTAIESQRTSTGISSSSSRVSPPTPPPSSLAISAWDSLCRGWTTDSSPPRFVCTLPSSSVALPPLWPRLHDYTLAFLGPGIVLLLGRVYQWIILLVLVHVFPHPAEKKNKRVKPYVSLA